MLTLRVWIQLALALNLEPSWKVSESDSTRPDPHKGSAEVAADSHTGWPEMSRTRLGSFVIRDENRFASSSKNRESRRKPHQLTNAVGKNNLECNLNVNYKTYELYKRKLYSTNVFDIRNETKIARLEWRYARVDIN